MWRCVGGGSARRMVCGEPASSVRTATHTTATTFTPTNACSVRHSGLHRYHQNVATRHWARCIATVPYFSCNQSSGASLYSHNSTYSHQCYLYSADSVPCRRSYSTFEPGPNSHTPPQESPVQPSSPRAGTPAVMSTLNPLLLRFMLPLMGGVYVAYHFVGRSKAAQRLYIYRSLSKTLKFRLQTAFPMLERPLKSRILSDHLNSPPTGPTVIVGPDGAGTTQIIQRVMQSKKMTIYLDLRRFPVVDGEELVTQFISESGYIVPPTKVVSRLLLRDETKFALTNEEITRAFTCFEDVLAREKKNGWPNGIPVICFDGFHYFGSSNDLDLRSKNIYEDKAFLKFLDWLLSLTDAKLCHVVFETSFAFCHLELDTHSGFRRRRELLQFPYASFATVYRHFKEKINPLLAKKDQLALTEEEMELLATVCGGHTKDIDMAITGLLRGRTSHEMVDQLITDSLQYVEDVHENMLIEGDGIGEKKKKNEEDEKQQAKEKHNIYAQYLRLWKLVEIFNNRSSIPRRDVIRHVFQDNVHELENYESHGLVTYVQQKIYTPFSPTPAPSIDCEGADEKLKPKAEESGPKPEDEIPRAVRMFQSPEVLLTPGTPRLHIAFQILFRDPRVREQTRWIELQVKKKQLDCKLDKLKEERLACRQEKAEMIHETRALLEFKDEWQQSFGMNDFNQKRDELVRQSQELVTRMSNNQQEARTTETRLQECETELKALQHIKYLVRDKPKIVKQLTG
eukprot:TRINITY_DN8717_c0_g1_i2.p1 TRINITY_DN8717_c0_g1~~TRINITY_DN8717_c0_g1_i2.p1  ORF type:complete len:747 (-),score=126.94 TRINITY_DN8717_c0_g1_i2:29-2248(-)